MKLYESKKDTPLQFFNFYKFIALMGILGNVYSIADLIIDSRFNWYGIVHMAASAVGIFLYVLILLGLSKWKRYVPVLIFTVILFGVILYGLDIAVGVIFALQNLSIVIAQAAIYCVVNSLVALYFYKRKRLFDGVAYIRNDYAVE